MDATTTEKIKKHTTWKDAKGKLWTITDLFYAELTSTKVVGVNIYRVGSKAHVVYVPITQIAESINKGLFIQQLID